MSDLELITRRPQGTCRPRPLLFVHGSFSHAGIWDVNFLPYFADLGYEAHAVSLRGHGNSEGQYQLPWFSLSDYVADVVEVIGRLPQPPVLIGHSMGGMVVQRVLRSCCQVPAAVLMASVPPYGMWDSTIGMLFRDPLLVHQLSLLMSLGFGVVNITSVRRALFSDRVADSELLQYESLFQSESQRVVMDMLFFDPYSGRPDPSLPVLVLGAADDLFFTAPQVEATAEVFGTKAIIFPDMAHCMMIEPDWRLVAESIAHWLEKL